MLITRKAEALDDGHFKPIAITDLRRGHVFRLFEEDGTPESGGQVCLALGDFDPDKGMLRCEPMSMVPNIVKPEFVKTITIDFDGVLHDYEGGWKGKDVVAGKPVDGAFEWLYKLLADPDFEPVVYSSRSDEPTGVEAMKRWFHLHGFKRVDELKFPTQKPPAWLTLDDRCFLFQGRFPTLREMAEFKPWNR